MNLERRACLVLLLALLLGLSARAGSSAPIEPLGRDAEPLRNQFNQDAASLRLLLILDPT